MIVLLCIIDFWCFKGLPAVTFFDFASDLMEVFKVCKVLLNCADDAFLVNVVADRVVAGYCAEVQLVT